MKKAKRPVNEDELADELSEDMDEMMAEMRTMFHQLAPKVKPDSPIPFGYKSSWLAIRTDSPDGVTTAMQLRGVLESNWRLGLEDAYGGGVFVTPNCKGWVLVVSSNLPELSPTKRDDRLTPLIKRLCKKFDDVQYFGTHRVVQYSGWLRAKDGKIVRRYGYVGDKGFTICDEGSPTVEEKKLRLAFDETTHPTEDDVMKLAGAWSIDPTKLDRLKLGKGLGYTANPIR